MYARLNRLRNTLMAAAAMWTAAAGTAQSANSLPIADAWNITSTGKASSSGELLFRVSGESGHEATEVIVFVLSGSNETGVASSIRKALASQLDGRRFNVEAGDGPNVLLTGENLNRGFSVELVESDVESVRVTVQSATPVAPPTVPTQQLPADPPVSPRTPPAPDDGAPPLESPGSPAIPTPPPDATAPANGGAGAPASAPPPPSGAS